MFAQQKQLKVRAEICNLHYLHIKGDRYWRLISDAIAPGNPRQVASDWGALLPPPHIDAAETGHLHLPLVVWLEQLNNEHERTRLHSSFMFT